MEPTLVLVLGGARSGKSRHAEALVQAAPPPWTYIATAESFDAEMAVRIAEHRARRPAGWSTTDAPRELPSAIAGAAPGVPLLVDCLTLWLSNLMLADAGIEAASDALAASLAARRALTVAVSNEVGSGVVPATPLGRRFRDAQGRLNQRVAAQAGRVELMVAGLALRVK